MREPVPAIHVLNNHKPHPEEQTQSAPQDEVRVCCKRDHRHKAGDDEEDEG
jgi:hypothetical protein